MFFVVIRRATRSTLFPYTTLFRSHLRRLLTMLEGDTDAASSLRQCDQLRVELHASPKAFGEEGRELIVARSEEHTSELQSHVNLVCRLQLEKKNQMIRGSPHILKE